MRLYYEGTDITDSVDIVEAVHRDVSDGRCDSLKLTLEHAAAWYRWGPRTDDRIEMRDGEYTTGTLFLDTVAPEGDAFCIVATGSRSGARRRAWASYENRTLLQIIEQCASESGMESRIYGVEEGHMYPYLLRKMEGCAAFLSRLLHWEGAVLKTAFGRYTAIGVAAAQKLEPGANIELSTRQRGVSYLRRENTKYASITVKTPYGQATAYDSDVEEGEHVVVGGLPAMDNATAGRWARGMLTMHNRRAERLTLESEYNVGFTAMARIDVSSGTDMAGEWIIDEVEHDFVNKKSRAQMLRCTTTIV